MPSVVILEADELCEFSLPHAVRLVGEHQHLLGGGSIALATNLRVRVEVAETHGDFTVSFRGGAAGDGWTEGSYEPVGDGPHGAEPPASATWRDALGELAVPDSAMLEGLSICVDLGELWDACPSQVLAASPSVAAALAVAVTAHRGGGRHVSDVDLAQLACRLRGGLFPAGSASADRFYGEALLSIVGGAGYVEPAGERLNVQQLLPPESLLVALAPAASTPWGGEEGEEIARRALSRARGQIGDVSGADDASLSALFGLSGGVLTEQETTMLYGLLRVRQMAESFLERLGDPLVDNDVLAEMCDEESTMLQDYFSFPGDLYGPIRAAAGEAGALGAKLTWAFGGCPAAVIIAPGRRDDVLAALQGRFPDARVLPLNLDATGLLRGGPGLSMDT